MKLTRKEAERLIDMYSVQEPSDDVIEKVTSHVWSFDPRGNRLMLVRRQFHEQDYVFNATYRAIVKVGGPPVDAAGEMDCALCAARITREPYYAVMDRCGGNWLTCGECVAALTGHNESSSTNLERVARAMALHKMGALITAARQKGIRLIRGC